MYFLKIFKNNVLVTSSLEFSYDKNKNTTVLTRTLTKIVIINDGG